MSDSKKIFPVLFLLLTLHVSCPAEERDNGASLGLTTFYPSPHGVFKKITVENLSLGEVSQPGSGTSGVMRLEPRQEPGTGATGNLYFDSGNKFKYYNGEEWKDMGGESLSGLCGLFFGSHCPEGFELKETRTAMEDEYVTATYIWRRDNQGHMETAWACEPQTIIDPHNPPPPPSTGCFSKRYNSHKSVCNICSGKSGVEDVIEARDASGAVIEGEMCGSIVDACLYRCVYPGDPGWINLSNEYQVSLCCPTE